MITSQTEAALLDQDQLKVINESEGARAVLAGPGSGKTTTMVGLVNALLSDGVPASSVRAITFSKEMAKSLEKKLKIPGIASTFHSLGYLICSEMGRKPVEPELRFRLMMQLIKKYGLDYKELDGFIAKARRMNISPEDAMRGDHDFDWRLSRAYADYEIVRAREGWMDFDSMLVDALAALAKPDVRRRWQYKYCIIDEAQDTDDCAWRMAQLMTETHGNITVVGDPNQCIYSFRGAQPENITNFQKWFPTGRYFYLGRNYRSTRRIVQFIRENLPKDCPAELRERMVAARADEGARIGMKMYWTDDEEAESAITLARKDPFNSIILVRTNSMVGLLERICNEHKVRYHLLGKTGFWKQTEIRKAIEELKNFPTLSTEAAMSMVMPKLEAKYAVDNRTERDNDALQNLKTLHGMGRTRGFKMAREFVAYANRMVHRRNDPNGVTISTVHQAKGGEWKNVYIIGANAKGFPHPKGDPKEEERIYLVAISRPTDYLRISFAGTPSPYLRQYLTDEILDRLREHATEVEKLQTQTKLFV